MKNHLSPLRYPGGKGDLAPFLANLIVAQPRRPLRYVEPFAGGAGAALRLLFAEYVDEIVINDLDPGIAAFWRAVFGRTDELVSRIRSCHVSIAEWHRQREVYVSGRGDDVDLGYATFFLNRTNRSGILNARPIGGLRQDGAWKIDVRFNKPDLLERITMIARYRARVTVCQEDGIGLLARAFDPARRTFCYVDPPYLERASDLYLNTLTWRDHRHLASLLRRKRNNPWVLTYDHDRRVPTELYPDMRVTGFDIAHTAARQYVGREYAVFSDALHLGKLEGLRAGN